MFTCLCDSQFAYLVKNEPLKTVVSIKHAFIYTVSSEMLILNEDTRNEDRLRDFWGFANNSDFSTLAFQQITKSRNMISNDCSMTQPGNYTYHTLPPTIPHVETSLRPEQHLTRRPNATPLFGIS